LVRATRELQAEAKKPKNQEMVNGALRLKGDAGLLARACKPLRDCHLLRSHVGLSLTGAGLLRPRGQRGARGRH
jgi:hypothetical protein